jgi:DNA-directed RNA polymerase subunit alpha
VWTDGTMTPAAALGEAAQLLSQRLGLFSNFGQAETGVEEDGAARTQVSSRVAEAQIEELDLSVRAYNCLKANDIFKVGDLLKMSEAELMGLRNFGRKSLDEIKEKLVAKGFVSPEQLETLFK